MGQHILAWSGGKDAAFALNRMQEVGDTVHALWTTVNEGTQRSSMHGVRRELYERQAAAIGLPITVRMLPPEVDNETYQALVQEEFEELAEDGVQTVSYADVHLEGVREYREGVLNGTGLSGNWPIWGMDTADLVQQFIQAGFEATVVAVDGGALDPDILGSAIDEEFLRSLPDEVDPAGEGGEYHTFVTDGPIFDEALEITTGETVERTLGETTMYYLDIKMR